jgi:hypothetical protein
MARRYAWREQGEVVVDVRGSTPAVHAQAVWVGRVRHTPCLRLTCTLAFQRTPLIRRTTTMGTSSPRQGCRPSQVLPFTAVLGERAQGKKHEFVCGSASSAIIPVVPTCFLSERGFLQGCEAKGSRGPPRRRILRGLAIKQPTDAPIDPPKEPVFEHPTEQRTEPLT